MPGVVRLLRNTWFWRGFRWFWNPPEQVILRAGPEAGRQGERGGPGGPRGLPREGKKCAFNRLFNNSPSRDNLFLEMHFGFSRNRPYIGTFPYGIVKNQQKVQKLDPGNPPEILRNPGGLFWPFFALFRLFRPPGPPGPPGLATPCPSLPREPKTTPRRGR